MCVAIPMRVRAVNGLVALCEARGLVRTVSLFLVQHELPAVGDFVLVHLDSAIQRLDHAKAEATWATLDEVFGTGPIDAPSDADMQRSNVVSPARTAPIDADNDVIGSTEHR